MKHRGERPAGMEEVPPEARHTLRGLNKWLDEGRRSRGVPESGLFPSELFCPPDCTQHEHPEDPNGKTNP